MLIAHRVVTETPEFIPP